MRLSQELVYVIRLRPCHSCEGRSAFDAEKRNGPCDVMHAECKRGKGGFGQYDVRWSVSKHFET